MDVYTYNDILKGLVRDLVSYEIPFIRGGNGDITIINTKNNREDCIFIDERGLCFVAKGSEIDRGITLIRRDKEIVNRTLAVSTENYKHFLYAMNHDEVFRNKYAWPQSSVAKLALILCKGDPKFKKVY
mgnify:FL=1